MTNLPRRVVAVDQMPDEDFVRHCAFGHPALYGVIHPSDARRTLSIGSLLQLHLEDHRAHATAHKHIHVRIDEAEPDAVSGAELDELATG